MSDNLNCPVCQNRFGGTCVEHQLNARDGLGYSCTVCGLFSISRSALASYFPAAKEPLEDLQSTALSHALRATARENANPFITTDWMERFLADARLPSPAEQAANIIRFVGDYVRDKGYPLPSPPPYFFAQVGARNPDSAAKLLQELIGRGMLTGANAASMQSRHGTISIDLTLDGWERYEQEKRGKSASDYGFIALQFGDALLDPFLRDIIKPAAAHLGYRLVDMRDVAQPGLIDNIMREKIRDAAFVLVDLTHDNSGAYWEAGYAEGLGKSVLYLCEGGKFKEKKTHFDTNHLTTVTWGDGKSDETFADELRATLRRALNLFETA